MTSTGKHHSRGWRSGWLIVTLACVLPVAAVAEDVQHYRMISAVEYVGQGQFRNQVETVFTVSTEQLAKNQVRFQLQADRLRDANMSFVVDRQTQQLSDLGQDMGLWARLSNTSIQTVQKVGRKDVGRTWKQQTSTGELANVLGESLMFTVTAIEVNSAKLGEMVAVRALSEPFTIQTSAGPARAKVNSVYLFDAAVENIYFSACVFETATTARGFKEILHSEVVTFRTNAEGVGVSLGDAEDGFVKLVEKVGLVDEPVRLTNPTALPQWAQSEGLLAAQAGHVCGSNVCEGAVNPVSSVSMPAVKVIEIQKKSEPKTTNAPLEELKLLGLDLSNKWVLGGVIAGAVAIPLAMGGGGGGGGGGHPASPR